MLKLIKAIPIDKLHLKFSNHTGIMFMEILK